MLDSFTVGVRFIPDQSHPFSELHKFVERSYLLICFQDLNGETRNIKVKSENGTLIFFDLSHSHNDSYLTIHNLLTLIISLHGKYLIKMRTYTPSFTSQCEIVMRRRDKSYEWFDLFSQYLSEPGLPTDAASRASVSVIHPSNGSDSQVSETTVSTIYDAVKVSSNPTPVRISFPDGAVRCSLIAYGSAYVLSNVSFGEYRSKALAAEFTAFCEESGLFVIIRDNFFSPERGQGYGWRWYSEDAGVMRSLEWFYRETQPLPHPAWVRRSVE